MMASDAAPIRPEERFDEVRVAAYLRAVIPQLASTPDMEFAQFHGGHANLTYTVTAGETEYVLRRPPLGETAPGSHDMGREHRVLAVLHQAFPLAPRAIHHCGDASVMGKPFFVMERRHGTVIRGRWPDALGGGDLVRRRVGEEMIGALAALHGVDFEVLGLGDIGQPEGFVARQVSGWTTRWQRARTAEVPEMDQLAAALGSGAPRPQRASLLHNDFKLDNTMVDNFGHLTAVFDWDMATIGDPLVDLGTTLVYYEGPGEAEVVVPPDRRVLGGAIDAEELLAQYATATGLDCSDISWYRGLASFRIAVILQQIYVRYARGQTTDERFAGLGAAVRPIAASGLGFLRGSANSG